jgi:hypothetical protein
MAETRQQREKERERQFWVESDYYSMFEDTIDCRLIPAKTFARLPELMEMAVKRGSMLTDEELGIEARPPDEVKI